MNANRRADMQSAELAFAVAGTAMTAVLALILPYQSAWQPGRAVSSQPGLWPALAIALMLASGACWIAGLRRTSPAGGDPPGRWLVAAEYVVWFLVYGWLVPLVGYLPATAIALPLLTRRAGYRGWRPAVMAVATALGLALVFQVALSVALPADPLTGFAFGLPSGAKLWRY